MTQHKPTAYLPPSSPYSEECRTCGLEWPCPAEIARRQRGPHSDPYAVRARTHRSDGIGEYLNSYASSCKRCGKRWPCPKADTIDPQLRYRGALLAGAMAAVGTLCVGFTTWLFGWWPWS